MEVKFRSRKANNNQRARVLGLPYNIHEHDIQFLLNYFDYKCVYCEKDIRDEFHIDHIVPLSDSEYLMHPGTTLENITVCCPDCNYSKGDKDYETWIRDTFDNHEIILEKIEFFIVSVTS